MKTAGILMIVAACAFAGWARALRLARRVEELERFRGVLQAIRTEIRFSAAPLETLIRRYADRSDWLASCAEALKHGVPFPEAWRQAVAAAAAARADKNLLLEFGEGLGATDIEGQTAHCALCAEKLEALLKEAYEEKAKKGKLYVTLGVSAGITLGLLLM